MNFAPTATKNLQLMFDYDLWANSRWLDVIPKLKSFKKGHELMAHIVGAQEIWYQRCNGHLPEGYDKLTEPDNLAAMVEAWKTLLETADLDQQIHYQTRAGDPYTHTIGEIALHAINHGTYTRGHLRGLCDAEDFEDFHDTDFILFLRK